MSNRVFEIDYLEKDFAGEFSIRNQKSFDSKEDRNAFISKKMEDRNIILLNADSYEMESS